MSIGLLIRFPVYGGVEVQRVDESSFLRTWEESNPPKKLLPKTTRMIEGVEGRRDLPHQTTENTFVISDEFVVCSLSFFHLFLFIFGGHTPRE